MANETYVQLPPPLDPQEMPPQRSHWGMTLLWALVLLAGVVMSLAWFARQAREISRRHRPRSIK